MNPKQIERFFKILAKKLDGPSQVVLTGAANGSLLGGVRPSLDIDFAIDVLKKSPEAWAKVSTAIEGASRAAGISVNFAEDIDRWGMVSLLDYKKHTRLFWRFGSLWVKTLDPRYWSIGKMTRYLESDAQDMVQVFRRQKVPFRSLSVLWAKALRASPPSTGLFLVRKHVETFYRDWGRKVWGTEFDPEKAINGFRTLLGRK